MSDWFGKQCKFQCCQWEENEQTGGPKFRESLPALIFCNHTKNPEDTEGNCREKICPLGLIDIKKILEFENGLSEIITKVRFVDEKQ